MTSQIGKKLFCHFGALLSLVIVCIALYVMYNTLRTISLSDVITSLRALSATSLMLGFVITALSYLTVTGYDVIALVHIKRKLPYSRAALSAFLASTFGNNIGFAILTGTSIRYRIYSPLGLSSLDIAGISSMCALTTMLGMSFVFSIAIQFGGDDLSSTGTLIPVDYLKIASTLILSLIGVYLAYSLYRPITFRSQNWTFRMPGTGTVLTQIFLATTNLSLVASLIFVLLPDDTDVSYLGFLGVFAMALIAGSASNVPGGIGVFESVILLGLPEVPPAALLGSILLFRCIYYLTPLAIAAILLVYHEAERQKKQIGEIQESALDVLDEIGPQIMSLIILVAGVILLFSGSIPAGFDRSETLIWVPLLLVEISHFIGAAAGIGLLIAARGISRRLSSAFGLCVKLLLLGMLTTMVKGFGFRESIALGTILGLLWYTRSEFHRNGSLFDEGFPVEWVSLLSIILSITIWLGLFSFKGITYTGDLWWTFSFENDYGRFLRSLLGVIAICGVVTYINLLRPDPLPGLPETIILDRIRQILAEQSSLTSNLVLLGDKRILFSERGNAFIMYQIQGKSWVALGDPIGPDEEFSDLIWSFRGLCDRYGAWPVFYMVNEDHLSEYDELDLSIERIGDEAVMPLENFELKGAMRTELIEVHRRVHKQGVRAEVLQGEELHARLPDLKTISDQWLQQENQIELGFSRGFFDPYYIINFPCLIASIDNRPVAFAVIWTTPDSQELGLDLVRFNEQAPVAVTDYLIIESMLWGKSRGYTRFNLGIAPIPGLKDHPLSPLWHRIGVLMYRSSGNSSVDDLRGKEEKFNPQWRPKYIVSPGGVKTPRILQDIGRLISQRNAQSRDNADS